MRRKFCQLTQAVITWAACIVLLSLSFEAAMNIRREWMAADYWLAWFAGLSFIGGFVLMGLAIVASCFFWDGLCGQDNQSR